MGATSLKTAPEPEFNEKTEYRSLSPSKASAELQSLRRRLGGLLVTENTDLSVTESSLAAWEQLFVAEPKNRVVQNALAASSFVSLAHQAGTQSLLQNQYLFNLEVDTVGSAAFFNDQQQSGRCWIFAFSNVVRTRVIRSYNLRPDAFQLSQAYLFFYDRLEKANVFLENAIDTADLPLDDSYVQFLFNDPVSDGGQWDFLVNLVAKYGLVPQEVFPDNAQTKRTRELDTALTLKLREYALVLRRLKTLGETAQKIASVKNAFNKEVYVIVSLALGSPPKPSDSFLWEFKDKDGKFRSFETTPKNFYRDHVAFDASQHFSLINDPRNSYGQLYTVDRMKNVHDGIPIGYVNTTLDEMKKAVIRLLRANEPVFFGCDFGPFINGETGIMDPGSYSYELVLGTKMGLSKKERLLTRSTAMTHAVTFVGVHLDKSGNPVRWKVENSWGPSKGNAGYYLMSNEWFEEYVLQVVVNKKYAESSHYNVWKGKQYRVLPYDDPMGVLA